MTQLAAPPELPLIARFREAWTRGAYPIVSRTEADGVVSLCAAPSMWLVARQLAHGLASCGLKPGDLVGYDGPEGPEWVEALVGTLRAGGCFSPDPSAASFRVAADLSVTRGERLRPLGVGIRLEREFFPAYDWHLRCRRTAPDIAFVPPGWSAVRPFFDALLPALVEGSEIVLETTEEPREVDRGRPSPANRER